jgi:MFS family permease
LTNALIEPARIGDRTALWPERFATLAAFAVNGGGIGAWAAAIPRLKAVLGVTDAKLSLVLLSFAAGAIVVMPLTGLLAAKIRSGRAASVAGAAFAAALALPAFAPNVPVLAAAAAALGAANGAMDVAMNAHASDVERRWGSPIMSSFHAGWSLGGVLGAIVGAALAGVAAPLGLMGPCLVGLVAVALCSRRLSDAGTVVRGGALALPGRKLMPLAAQALLSMMTEGAVADWSGAYLAQSGVALELAASAYAAFSFCMIIGRILGDSVVRAAGRRLTVAIGGVAASAGLALSAASPGLVGGVVGFALVGAGLANVVPAVFSAAGRTGSSPSVAIASVATAGYAGLLLGPVAVGGVAALADLRAAIGMLAVVALLAAALASSGVSRLRG